MVLFLKFIIGLLLLPICWVSLETFFLLFKQEALSGAFYSRPEFFFFSAGAVACLFLFLVARRNKILMWFYVLGHELTHAFFVLVFRGQVKKIHVTADEGGHILSNRNNFIISLSPYFFPFYTIVVIAVWGLLGWLVFDFAETDFFWLFALIGFTWMFHSAYTVWMLRQNQSDVQINGKLFSFSVILLLNILLISCLLIIASPTATFKGFGLAWVENFDSLGGRFMSSLGELTGKK